MTRFDNVKVKEDDIQRYRLAGVEVNSEPAKVISAKASTEIKFINGDLDFDTLALKISSAAKLSNEVVLTVKLLHENYAAPQPVKPAESKQTKPAIISLRK